MSDDGFVEIRSGTLVLGRFEIRDRVARGGFAVVWKAHDRLLGKDVALKILHDSIAEDPAAVEELKRETLRSRDLTHPHIVQTYDFVQDGPVVALAMEYVDGATMATLAAQRPNGCFNPRDIAAWMGDVCDALDYAHSEKGGKKCVVHHDIKPSNFIVDTFGTAKVLDFGIAKSVAETRYQHTGTFAVAGTPPYMSPQQLLGQRPRPADDIYSLGATIYSLLTGKPPFYHGDLATQIGHETAPTMNRRRAELEIDEPPIAQEWEETIVACLAKDPEHRPKTMSEVAVRLGVREPSTRRAAPSAADAALRRAARPEPTPRPTTRRVAMKRKRGWIALVPVAAAAAAVLLWPGRGFLQGWPRPDESRPVDPRAVCEPAEAPVLADAGLFGAASPAAKAAFDALDARDRAIAERTQRVNALRRALAGAVAAEKWEDAAHVVPDLLALEPKDEDATHWGPIVSDQLAIRDLVERYRVAQEALDADAYRRLWVGLDESKVAAMRRSYADLAYLTLEIRDVDAQIGATTAMVRFHESLSFDLSGIGRQTTEATTDLTLQRMADGWRIAARVSQQ